MTKAELKTAIAKIEAMKPTPGGRLSKRLNRLKIKLNATSIDMLALLIG